MPVSAGIHELSYWVYYPLENEIVVQPVASLPHFAFAAFDFPGILLDSSSQLKITILCV